MLPRPPTGFRHPWFTGLALRVAGILAAWILVVAGQWPAALHAAAQPFRITHLAFTTNGPFIAPEVFRNDVRTLFYGAPITNLVFRTELPPRDPVPPAEPATQGPPVTLTSDHAPPRPDHPSHVVDRWQREHGLPANKVHCLIQTRDGYLWIGTTEGLVRFDGVRFVIFNGENSPMMLSEGTMPAAFCEDAAGRLWIGTERGLLLMENGIFKSFPGQESLRGRRYLWITQRKAGGLWLGHQQGLHHFADSVLREYTDRFGNRLGWVRRIIEDGLGAVWYCSSYGFFRLNPASRELDRLDLGDPTLTDISDIQWDEGGRLWVGTSDGIWQWDRGEAHPIHTGSHPIREDIPAIIHPKFARDSSGRIWASSRSGDSVLRFSQGGRQVERFVVGPLHHDIGSLLVDHDDVLWMGSWRNGIARLEVYPFNMFRLGDRIHSHNIRSITEGSDGTLWAGAAGGFIRWSGREVAFLEFRTGMLRDQGRTILAVPSGRVWGAFPFGGIMQLPVNDDDPWMQLVGNVRHFSAGEIHLLFRRSNGTLWMGTTNGLHAIVTDTQLATFAPPRIAHADVRVLLEDQSQRLWVGTSGGLDCFDGQPTGRWTGQDGLPSPEIEALFEDADGALWIGTSRGLCHLKNGILRRLDGGSGMPRNAIQQILEDDQQRLWIRHAGGIVCVNRADLNQWIGDPRHVPRVTHFGPGDGLAPSETRGRVQHPTGIKARDGRLWFSTAGGLAVVDPDEWSSPKPPSVVIEQFMADGLALLGDGATNAWRPNTPAIRLAPGRAQTVAIRFTVSQPVRPERVNLSYRLDGLDPDWRPADMSRSATYLNLKPGRYTFRVRACARGGIWSESEATLNFVYPPLWWKTWPFYLGCGAGVLAMAGGFTLWQLRLQRQILRLERDHALDLERARIARDMHDQLGADLSRIALAAGERSAAQSQVREAVQGLNALIWAVNPTHDTLSGLADFISNLAHQYLGAAGIGLDLDIPAELPAVEVSSSVRSELAGAFKETLRNLVQHSRAKRARVALRVLPTRLQIEVADDGLGFDPSRIPTPPARSSGGRGLANLRRRLEALGGTCELDSAPGRGTRVEFRVPLQ